MGFIQGIFGFFVGLVFGGIALMAAIVFLPQIQVPDTPKQEPTVQGSNTSENVAPVAEESETVKKPESTTEPDVATTEEAPVPETVEENAKAPVAQAVEEGAATEPDTTEQPAEEVQTVEEPVADAPMLVLQSEEPEEVTPPKKFNLPTIEVEEEPENVAEEPVVVEEPTPGPETGITIGKKPSSSLPSITQEAPEADVAIATQAAIVTNALELYATKFALADRPLLGVVLMDVGDQGLAVDKLKKLNAPITIAIRVDDANASARALEYSAAGFEVIAMAPENSTAALNVATTASQVKDAIDVVFTTVPNAIGLMDNAQASLQKNSRAAKEIVKFFVDTGHGLISNTKGINTLDREARAVDVRTAKVARTLDGNHESKAVIMRYLDRVSLDAGRDGAVIIQGTTAKETVATIAVWLLSSKGQSVTLAPVSAVLLGE